MIDRRTFSTALVAGVATALFGGPRKAQAQPTVSAHNVVWSTVHMPTGPVDPKSLAVSSWPA